MLGDKAVETPAMKLYERMGEWPPYGEAFLDDWRATELMVLAGVEADLYSELRDGALSAAQKLTALSELRKIVELRCRITGVIVPAPATDDH